MRTFYVYTKHRKDIDCYFCYRLCFSSGRKLSRYFNEPTFKRVQLSAEQEAHRRPTPKKNKKYILKPKKVMKSVAKIRLQHCYAFLAVP